MHGWMNLLDRGGYWMDLVIHSTTPRKTNHTKYFFFVVTEKKILITGLKEILEKIQV